VNTIPKMVFLWLVGKRETKRRKRSEKPEPIEPKLTLLFYGYIVTPNNVDTELVKKNATVKFLIQPSGEVCLNNTPMMKITEKEKGKCINLYCSSAEKKPF